MAIHRRIGKRKLPAQKVVQAGEFNFIVATAGRNCYVAVMSRKTASSSDSHHHGLGDVIGVALLAAALLLLVAQFSFDRYDLSFFKDPHNKPVHNWIGTVGAYLAWSSFLPFGLVAYVLPWLLAAFGAAYLLNFLGYLRERLRWSLLWSVILLVSLTGLLYILDNANWLGKVREDIGAQSAGGWLGYATYGQTAHYEYGFCLLGNLGATIVYATLCVISLLFLTNFRLGVWIRAFLDSKDEPETKPVAKPAEEIALERRAKDLEKQAQKLQEEVARSGLGADLQPVPEPTVRDLSVPQNNPLTPARARKTTLPEHKAPAPPAPADEVEVIPAKEIVAATTADILGEKSADDEKPVEEKTDSFAEGKAEAEKAEPEIKITGITPARPKPESPSPSPSRRRR